MPFKLLSILLALMLGSTLANAQSTKTYSSKNKKAIKLYQEGDYAYRRRNFEVAITAFEKAIEKDKNFIEPYYRLGQIAQRFRQTTRAIRRFEQVVALAVKEPGRHMGAWLALSQLHLSLSQYNKAEKYLNTFIGIANTQNRFDKRLESQTAELSKRIAFAKEQLKNPLPFEPKPLSGSINALPLQYFPVLTANNQNLVFTGRKGNGSLYDEDLYISTLQADSTWSQPQSISANINSPTNEGTCSISADGRTLIFTSCLQPDGYGSCDLYVSYKEGNTWTKPQNMGKKINSGAWESQPSLSADGRVLYFVSDRSGGEGKRDIYMVYKLDCETWCGPYNLGKAINTPGNEVSPFIHANGISLYFASDHHMGMGGFDLFLAEMDQYGEWKKPTNLGYPINDADNQVSLFVTPNGQTALYSHEYSQGGYATRSEIYTFELPPEARVKARASYVTGRVYNAANQEPLDANVQLYNIEQDSLERAVSSDKTSGLYTMVLNEGRRYALYINKPGFVFKSIPFDFKETFNGQPIEINVALEPIKPGASVVLPNIFFGTNSYYVEEASKTELKKLAQFLKENPNVNIEIQGHTDNQGTKKYNQELSLNRAQEVWAFLVLQRIDRRRLTCIGLADEVPVASNDTEEGRQLNRRIEFLITQ